MRSRQLRNRFSRLGTLGLLLLTLLTSCAANQLNHGEAAETDLRLKEALQLMGSGQPEIGEQKLKVLATERPLHVLAHRELQRLRLSRFEHMHVLNDYQQLVEELPQSGSAHYLLGRLLYRLEDQRALFQAAADLDPKNPWGFQGLAWNAVARGQFDDAFKLLNYALAAEPRHARSRYLMIRLLLAQGRTEQARGMLVLLLKQEPDEASYWVLSAQLGSREGSYSDVLDALERALTLDPSNEEARELLLDLIRITDKRALSFLAIDFGQQLIDPASQNLNDLLFLTKLGELGHDFSSSRLNAKRALKFGASSPSLLHTAHFEAVEYFRAWKELYEADQLALNQPIVNLEEVLRVEGHSTGLDNQLRVAEAFVNAGFLDYGSRIVRDLSASMPSEASTRLSELASVLRKHKRVLARIQVIVDRNQARPQSRLAESLQAFLENVAQIIQDETGYICNQPEPILGLPLVGAAIDSAKANEGTINGYLRRFNQVMFSGRLEGAATQAVVFSVLSGPNRVLPDLWPNDLGCVEFIGGMVEVRSQDESFGDSAGRALFGTYFVDLDVLIPWKSKLSRIADETSAAKSLMMENHALEANGSSERLSMAYPGVISEALVLRAMELHRDLHVLDAVIIHEQGHLLDSFNYLPLWQRIIPNLLLVFRGGFSSKGVMAELEDTAAHYALRFAKSPHVVLAELVRALPTGGNPGPHARGYKNLLARFLIYLDAHLDEFAQLSPNHVLMHQLHLLTEEQIRRIATDI